MRNSAIRRAYNAR